MVLLILAGITIVYVFGDNGVFKLAKEAKDKTEQAKLDEQEYLNSLDDMVNEYVSGNGGTTNPTTPEEVPIENIKSDWAIIEKIAKEIANDDSITNDSEEATVTVDGKIYTIKVGDMLEVEYNGEIRRVRVLGFKHDDLVDTSVYGSGTTATKASISFEFYDCLGTHNMNGTSASDATNANGWAATEMRTYLEGTNGIGQLSNKEYIKQVKKKYIKTYNNASSVTTSNDYLWLLAASEIVPQNSENTRYGYAITSEGSQYKYYQEVTEAYNETSTNRVKYVNGSANTWWLRSPYYLNAPYFCIVSSYGVANNANISSYYTYGVAPGFCI